MPEIRLDLGDAAELAEMLTFLAGWLYGSQKQALDNSLAAFVGHPAYNTDALLRRPAPVRLPPRDQRADAMISKTGEAHALDRITLPSMCD